MAAIFPSKPIEDGQTKVYNQIWLPIINISSPVSDGMVTEQISATITAVPYNNETMETDWKFARSFNISDIQQMAASGNLKAIAAFEAITDFVKDVMPLNLWEDLG